MSKTLGDKAALDDLLAGDYVLVNSRGQRQGKADRILLGRDPPTRN